jgi:hypothetical protein
MGMGMDMNFYRGYSRGRILSVAVDMVAGGYLQYPIRIRPVAIPIWMGHLTGLVESM